MDKIMHNVEGCYWEVLYH